MRIKHKLVKVEWLDAYSSTAGWKSIKKAKKKRPMVVVTVGWLVKERKNSITLVSSVCDDGDCDGDVVIPRGWVKKVKEL